MDCSSQSLTAGRFTGLRREYDCRNHDDDHASTLRLASELRLELRARAPAAGCGRTISRGTLGFLRPAGCLATWHRRRATPEREMDSLLRGVGI